MLLVPTVPGVQEQVAVQGEMDTATEVQIAVVPSLKVMTPARDAVAARVTAVPKVAEVALEGRATETVVVPKVEFPVTVAVPSEYPLRVLVTVTVAEELTPSPVTVIKPLASMETEPAEVVAEYEKLVSFVIWLVKPSDVLVAVPNVGLEAAPFETVNVIAKSLVALFASVAVTVALNVPSAVGVPVIAPVVESKDNPVGKVPLIA